MQIVTAFFRLIRIWNILIIAISISFFYYLIIVPVHKGILSSTLVPFTHIEFILFTLSVVLIAAAGNIINDYFDFELDKEFKPERPIASGIISLNTALYIHAAFVFSGIALGFYLGWTIDNYKIGYLYVICALLLYLYSAFLKKIPLAGNLVISALAAFVFVLPVIFDAVYLNAIHAQNIFENTGYAFNVLLWQMKFYAGFAFLATLAREIVKDLEDKEGDAEYDINTIAVQFGAVAAKIIAAMVILSLLAGLAYFIQSFYVVKATKEFLYLGICVAAPVLAALVFLLTAKQNRDYTRVSMFLKIIMLLGIFSIPAFYLFSKTTNL